VQHVVVNTPNAVGTVPKGDTAGVLPMRNVFALTIVTGLALTGLANATQSAPNDKVSACQNEARAGYALAWRMEPSLRPSIKEHRKRMSDACAAFVAGKSSSTAALSQCLRETSSGPAHVQRARNQDHAHIARQRDLCRDLAGTGRANPPPQ
jgi:hypothetical protein